MHFDRLNRREFGVLLGSAATWPFAARAQQPTMPVIGFMSGRSPTDSAQAVEGFRQGLRDTGYVEGESISIEYRWANGDYDRLPGFAADLLQRKVLVLVAVGGDPSLSRQRRRPPACPSSSAWAAIRSRRAWL